MQAKFSYENTEGRSHLGDLDVDGRTILKWIKKKWGMACTQLAKDRTH
jgi:hypothetical protein